MIKPLDAKSYDEQWSRLDDFIKHNPGARHRRNAVIKLINEIPKSNILDLGCGLCELIEYLINEFPDKKFSGADFSLKVIEQNRQRFPNLDFFELDIVENYLEKKFDTIIFSEVLEHLNERLKVFQNISSMLEPGGYLILTTPTGRIYETERRFGHTSHPTRFELNELAQKTNFKVIKINQWGFPFYTMLKYITNIDPDWSTKNFANGKYSNKNIFICDFLYYLNKLNLKDSNYGCQFFCLMQKIH